MYLLSQTFATRSRRPHFRRARVCIRRATLLIDFPCDRAAKTARVLVFSRVGRCMPPVGKQRPVRDDLCVVDRAPEGRASGRRNRRGPGCSIGVGGPAMHDLREIEGKEAGGIAAPRSRRRERLTVCAPRAESPNPRPTCAAARGGNETGVRAWRCGSRTAASRTRRFPEGRPRLGGRRPTLTRFGSRRERSRAPVRPARPVFCWSTTRTTRALASPSSHNRSGATAENRRGPARLRLRLSQRSGAAKIR